MDGLEGCQDVGRPLKGGGVPGSRGSRDVKAAGSAELKLGMR